MSPAKKAAVCLRHAALCALAPVCMLSSRPASANTPPAISGTPAAGAVAGQAYSFKPYASDPDHDTLKFSIMDKPAWLTFDKATGRLYGTPTAADVRKYWNIDITVSDGYYQARLPAFSITVYSSGTQLSPGSATIGWMPPTENTNGSTLTNLAGYRIYYGTSPTSLGHVVNITNPGLASYVLSNLAAGTWYAALTSVNTSGAESPRSAVVSTVVR
jgi:hypothetical protein